MMSQFLNGMSTQHTLLDMARGVYSNVEAVNIFGFNRTIGSTYETVWNDGASYAFPSSAVAMSVVSSSASDTMNLLIVGLDSDYNELTETVTLNGATAVTTTGSFLRINSAVILSGSNAGNITISNAGTTYAYIESALGATQACVYTVPAGSELFLFRLDFHSGTVNPNKYLTMRNQLISSNGRTLNVAETTMQNGELSIDRQVPFKITEKTDFQFVAKSSSGDNELSIFIEALLVKS